MPVNLPVLILTVILKNMLLSGIKCIQKCYELYSDLISQSSHGMVYRSQVEWCPPIIYKKAGFLLNSYQEIFWTLISHCCGRSNETGLRFACGWPEIMNFYWYRIANQIGRLRPSYLQRAGSGNLIGRNAHTHKVIHMWTATQLR